MINLKLLYKYIVRYTPTWKMTGTAYEKRTVTYDNLFHFSFSIGTKITTIASVFAQKYYRIGNIPNALATLGITIIAAAIDTYAAGKYETTITTYGIEVYAKSQLGLKTRKEKEQYTMTSANGLKKDVQTAVIGDTRSFSDLIHAGIYNVYIWNL